MSKLDINVAYEFVVDVWVELSAVVWVVVAPFAVAMATASCVTLEHIATRLGVAVSELQRIGGSVG